MLGCGRELSQTIDWQLDSVKVTEDLCSNCLFSKAGMVKYFQFKKKAYVFRLKMFPFLLKVCICVMFQAIILIKSDF